MAVDVQVYCRLCGRLVHAAIVVDAYVDMYTCVRCDPTRSYVIQPRSEAEEVTRAQATQPTTGHDYQI